MILPCLGGQGLEQAWLGSLAGCPVYSTSSPRYSFSAISFSAFPPRPRVFRQSRSVAVLAVGCDEGLSPALWAWRGFSETTSLRALLCGAFLPPS